MLPPILIHLAQTRSEFTQAYRLLQKAREDAGLAPVNPDPQALWLTKHHALPSANTVVATRAGEVLGALCLFGDSAFHLPLEETYRLEGFRASSEGRFAEISIPACAPSFPLAEDLQLALLHFALCFGAANCHYESFLVEAPAAWANRFVEQAGFALVQEGERGARVLHLPAREAPDLRYRVRAELSAEFRFPEKKFFLVAHQSMSPDVLRYLFNERTRVFEQLSDLELRVLKNIYDFGDYARALPERKLLLPFRKLPKSPRFPMNCEGYLTNPRGQRVNLQVIDVSRDGLKIRADQPLRTGESYALTLYIGVKKQTEMIVGAVWADELAQIAGVAVRSSDQNWAKLMEYLERDFLQAIA